MEGDGWSRTRRHQPRYDQFLGLEESDGVEEEVKPAMEFLCPFCGDEFDVVSLCLHVDDEHPDEASSRVCPICSEKVGTDLIGHIIIQHANYYKIQRKRRNRRASSGSSSYWVKDFHEGSLQSYFGGSLRTSAPDVAPDPLYSFISNLPAADLPKDSGNGYQDETVGGHQALEQKSEESGSASSLPEEDREELTLRSHFAQGLVLSTIFDDLW